MNLKKLAMLTALSAAPSFAFAEPATFDGPFVQAGIGFANSQTDVTTDFSFGSYRTKLNDDSRVGHVSGGWSHSIGQWNLAGSGYGVIGDQDAGPLSHNGIEAEFKLKDTWGVSFDPGYYLSPETLAYVRVGYVRTTAVMTATTFGSAERDFDGYSVGGGLKYAFKKNLYGFAEIQQANFARLSGSDGFVTRDISSLTGILGVGYRF